MNTFVPAKNRKELRAKFPNVDDHHVKKVTGGYIVFENADDYLTWKNAK